MSAPPPEPRRILLVMLRRIGDVILTAPAARALKKLYPGARVDFLTEPPCHEALEGLPYIDRVLVAPKPEEWLRSLGLWWRRALELRREGYDWAIDYMGNPRSALLTALSRAPLRAGPAHVAHRWAYNRLLVESKTPHYAPIEKIRVLRSLGLDPDVRDYMPRMEIPEEDREWARRALEGLGRAPGGPLGNSAPTTENSSPRRGDEFPTPSPGGRASAPSEGDLSSHPLVGFVPASRRETRRWPADSYGKLGRLLRDRLRARILVLWGPGEERLASRVAEAIGEGASLSPPTATLRRLAALILRCRLVVTNCNGPKHVAVACGVPTLTIHGSSDPACWNPPEAPLHRTARRQELPCIACRRNVCPYGLECMTRLEPEELAWKAEAMLAGGISAPPTEHPPPRGGGEFPTPSLPEAGALG